MARDQASTGSTSRDPRWPAILHEFDVQFLVLDTQRNRDLFQLFRSQPGWTLGFRDGNEVLFARAGTLDSAPGAA